MVAVELTFQNTSSSAINGVSIETSQLQSGMKIQTSVSSLQIGPGNSLNSTIGIDFNDTLQPAKFNIW